MYAGVFVKVESPSAFKSVVTSVLVKSQVFVPSVPLVPIYSPAIISPAEPVVGAAKWLVTVRVMLPKVSTVVSDEPTIVSSAAYKVVTVVPPPRFSASA